MTAAQKRLTLAAAILGSITAFIDSTIVNVALPRIRDDLGGGLAGQQWLTDAYLLTLGSLLLVGGSLGDLYGRRRIFAMGLVGFGGASLLCAAAPTIETLIVARGVQGLAAALLVPNTLGLLVARFEPGERGAAIGSWTARVGMAMVVGPAGGGLRLVDRVVGHRHGAGPAGRRAAAGRRVMALDLRHQPRARGRRPRAGPAARRHPRRPVRRPRRRHRRRAGDPRPGRPRLRAHRGPDARLGLAGDPRAARRWPGLPGRLRALRAPRVASDALARPLPPAQLRGGQRGDAGHLRRAERGALLPRALPAADRRLHRTAVRALAAAGQRDHVLAVAPLGRAGGPGRAALLHGHRPGDRRRGAGAAVPAGRER